MRGSSFLSKLAGLVARDKAAISEASVRDAAAIATLHASAFHRGWDEEEIERLLLDHNVIAHCAMRRRRLLGFILSRTVLDEAEILSVAVATEARKRGLARKLLAVHLHGLAAIGIRKIFLEVGERNEPARRLYRTAGFREVNRRERYYEGASGGAGAALVLRRDL
jgi:ribosomal-protein-alanine N-acetyltransferase